MEPSGGYLIILLLDGAARHCSRSIDQNGSDGFILTFSLTMTDVLKALTLAQHDTLLFAFFRSFAKPKNQSTCCHDDDLKPFLAFPP